MAKNIKTPLCAEYAPIDYIEMIDNYCPEAFTHCVEQLFPLFGLKILTKQDIRRVDLKEYMLVLTKLHYPVSLEDLSLTSVSYCEELRSLLVSSIKTEKGSRADRYRNRALELLDKKANESIQLQNISDALLIFVALMKPLLGHIDAVDNKCTQEPIFSYETADMDVLNEVWAVQFELANTSILGFKKKSDSNASISIKLWYAISVLLFCRILQERGAYNSEVV